MAADQFSLVLEVGALCRADPGDLGETAEDGLDKRRNVGEEGNG